MIYYIILSPSTNPCFIHVDLITKCRKGSFVSWNFHFNISNYLPLFEDSPWNTEFLVIGKRKVRRKRGRERERRRVSGIPRDNIGQGRRCPSKPTFPVFPCTLFPHIFPRGNFNVAESDQTLHISNPWLILLAEENWKVIKLWNKKKKKCLFRINVRNMLYDIHISLNMREKRFTFQIINQRIFHRFGLFNTFQRRRQTTFRKNNWLFNFRKVKSTESIINFQRMQLFDEAESDVGRSCKRLVGPAR